MNNSVVIHATAEVSPNAVLGKNVKIWHQAQVRERAKLGDNTIVGKGAYIDFDVELGANCKIQNSCLVYHGATLENGVFLGPGVILTNDRNPRAINADGTIKSADDWEVSKIIIKEGASLGAGTIVVAGVTIGKFALIGAGTVVTKDVPDYGLCLGVPGRICGKVDANAKVVERF